MKRLLIAIAAVASLGTVSGCTDYKATDKILDNDHRVIRQTRVHQRPTVVRVAQPQVQTVQVVQPQQQVNFRFLTRPQVAQLQRALAVRGLYRIPVDGVFGIRTAEGLAAYQRSIGARGPVTARTLEDLGLTF